MPKCTHIPTVTSTHDTYGISQPGLRTTCRIVVVSPGRKLAW
jgi:hypothetical protein